MSRILLIDDDEALREVLAMSLTSDGHEVVSASDGREGVELLQQGQFDLVITDLIMPGQEGIETITILRQDYPTLPVIAISGGLPNSELYLQIAQKIGAKRILAKPFALSDMRSAIIEVLGPRDPGPSGT